MIWGAPHVQGQVAMRLLLDPSQHIVEFGAFRNVLGRGRVSQAPCGNILAPGTYLATIRTTEQARRHR